MGLSDNAHTPMRNSQNAHWLDTRENYTGESVFLFWYYEIQDSQSFVNGFEIYIFKSIFISNAARKQFL